MSQTPETTGPVTVQDPRTGKELTFPTAEAAEAHFDAEEEAL